MQPVHERFLSRERPFEAAGQVVSFGCRSLTLWLTYAAALHQTRPLDQLEAGVNPRGARARGRGGTGGLAGRRVRIAARHPCVQDWTGRLRTLLAEAAAQGMPATDIVRGCQAAMADFAFLAAVAEAGNGSGSRP